MKDNKKERLDKAVKNTVEMDLKTHKQVAASVGISYTTLNRYYKEFPAKKVQIEFFMNQNKKAKETL